jgi:hypothetical protein
MPTFAETKLMMLLAWMETHNPMLDRRGQVKVDWKQVEAYCKEDGHEDGKLEDQTMRYLNVAIDLAALIRAEQDGPITVALDGDASEIAVRLESSMSTAKLRGHRALMHQLVVALEERLSSRPAQRIDDAQWAEMEKQGLDNIDLDKLPPLDVRDLAHTLRQTQRIAVEQAKRAEGWFLDLAGRILGEEQRSGFRMDRISGIIEHCAQRLGDLFAAETVTREKEEEIVRLGTELHDMDKARAAASDENERSLRALRSVVEMLAAKGGA